MNNVNGMSQKIYRRPDKWQSFQQKNLSKQLVTMVMQLVDLTQNNLEWTQAILRAAEAKKAPVFDPNFNGCC